MSNGRALSGLLSQWAHIPPHWDCDVLGLCTDSREVLPGQVFLARRGARLDATRFVDDAFAAGAAAAVVTGRGRVERRESGALVIPVSDVNACIGTIADRFYEQPSRRLRAVGVTGTNGKTSVTHFVARALEEARGAEGAPRSGVIGTLGYGLVGRLESAALTTPDAVRVHAELARMHGSGATEALMEVSSHALDQGRVAGVRFTTAALTNLSRDHLDYHRDMEAYARSKALLFKFEGLRYAVINLDDAFGRRLLGEIGWGVRVIGYRVAGAKCSAPPAMSRSRIEIVGRITQTSVSRMVVEVHTPWGVGELRAPLLGHFNAHNLLASLAIMLSLDVPLERACAALSRVPPVPGRMQRFGGEKCSPLVIVDYAHTPQALENALQALRAQSRGKLWCVFGCGGDRDPGKRSQMGTVAVTLADCVVITDDNPRSEDGWRIIEDIRLGVGDASQVTVERDRLSAVRYALHHAAPDDAVLVAGKGHEDYQEIGGARRPFSDAAAVQRVLEELAA